MDNKAKKLSLFTLVCIATGNVIGAGIITTTGLAIAVTGRSVWISYGLAVIFGFLWFFPTLAWNSIAKYTGGGFTHASATLSELWGGIYSLVWLTMFLMIGMLNMAFGLYASALVPAISAPIWSAIAGTLFFVLNLLGVKAMSRFQNPTTVFLLIVLIAFAVVGFFHLDANAFNFQAPDYFLNGGIGVFDGMMLLIYSTSGQALVTALSWNADKPRRNINLAITIATAIILVLYCSVSFVAGNVLPVEQVAGQPLTYVAKILFPGPLFLVFMIGGPIMALATSINASYSTMVAPALGAAMNGWLPKGIAKKNKHDVPWILYLIMYLISVLPIFLNVGLSQLTSYCVMTMRTGAIIGLIGGYFIPTKFKAQWEKSKLHMPNWLYYCINTVALVTNVICMISNIRTLSGPVFAINLVIELVLAGYAVYRYKAKKTTESSALIDFEND